jgi:hypothetical protein
VALTPLNLGGTAATVEVGDVTELPAGSAPTVENSGTSSAAVLDFGIPAADSSGIGDWTPGGGYAVGDLVKYEGAVWRLTATDTGNGYRTRPVVVTSVRTAHTTGSAGSQSVPSGITSQSVAGDLIVVVLHGQGTWTGVSVTNMTAAVTNYGAAASGANIGTRIAYAWHGGSTPSYNLGDVVGRATWLLIRGADPAGDLAQTATVDESATLPYILTGLAPSGDWTNALSVSSAIFHNTSAFATRLVPNSLVEPVGRHRFIGGGSQSIASATGSAIAAVDVCDSRDGSTAPTTSWWGYYPTSPTGAKARVATWLIPAKANGGPFFDRSKWQQLTWPGVVTTTDTDQIHPQAVRLPLEDRHYALTLDANFGGVATGEKYHRIVLPTPAMPSARHRIDLTVTVPAGGDHRIFTRWSSPQSRLTDEANFYHNGRVVEPARYGTTTLRYEWEPTALAWTLTGWDGAANVREYLRYDGDQQENLRVPIYFSPEVQAEDDFGTIRSAHVRAAHVLPVSTRKVFEKAGVCADIVRAKDRVEVVGWDSLTEGLWRRGTTDYSGLAQTSGTYGYRMANAVASWAPHDTFDGRVMLHELGHALDYEYLANRDAAGIYAAAPSGIDVTGPNPGYLSSERTLVDLYAAVTDKPGNYYRSQATEWVAQIAMTHWMHEMDLDGTQTTALEGLIGDVTNHDSGIYDDAIDYLISVGALRSFADWT